jgi:hypothetical protein
VPSFAGAAQAMFDGDAASRAAGIELTELGAGRAELRMRVTEGMVNGHGIAHRGSYDVTVRRRNGDGQPVIAEFRGRSRVIGDPEI